MAKFGDLLSELRRDKKLTQDELGPHTICNVGYHIQLREQRPLSRCRKTYTVGELF